MTEEEKKAAAEKAAAEKAAAEKKAAEEKAAKEQARITGYATLDRLGGSYATAGVKVVAGAVTPVNADQALSLKFDGSPVVVKKTEKEALDFIAALKKPKKKD